MSTTTDEPLITLTEAAIMLGVGEAAVRKRIESGRLPAHRKFSRILVRRDDVERLIASLAAAGIERLVPQRTAGVEFA